MSVCIKKTKTIKLPEVDWNLTPENAKNRGLVWISDSIMDPEAPDEANEEFVEMEADGYKFGEPANVNTITNNFVGVYKQNMTIQAFQDTIGFLVMRS